MIVHGPFEKFARVTPDAIATIFKGEELSYYHLNNYANVLSQLLLNHEPGVSPSVGIYLHSSTSFVIAVLAVLKAGGVVVPMDPELPEERLRFIARDASITMIITSEELYRSVRKFNIKKVLLPVYQHSRIIADNPESIINPEDPCGVFYTSGTTGNPKGIILTHLSVAMAISYSAKVLRFGETDRHILKCNIGFVAVLGEIFSALNTGGSLVIAEHGKSIDLEYIFSLIKTTHITVVGLTPSAMPLLVENSCGDNYGSIRAIVSSGEGLSIKSQNDCLKNLPVELHKFYGLTEAPCIAHSQCKIEDIDNTIVLGKPTYYQIYILNDDLEQVSVGEKGQIFVTGPLTKGYLNRPELTSERYIPSHFGDSPGALMFKTGDWGRQLSNGEIEFLGRIDYQVKVRGFRVELPEIEYQLMLHPDIDQAVVVDRKNKYESTFLVAYFTSKKKISSNVLHDYLANLLPDYMVPSFFVSVDKMPLTDTGKINRIELSGIAVENEEYVTAKSTVEKLLQKIWEDVLDIEKVSTTADFFKIGGDSIKAIRIISAMRRNGLNITLVDLFKYKTIAEISLITKQKGEFINNGSRLSVSGDIQRVKEISYQKLLPEELSKLQELYDLEDIYLLSPLQMGILFHTLNDEDADTYFVQTTYTINSAVDEHVVEETLNVLVEKHPVLRTAFDHTCHEFPLQIVLRKRAIKVALQDLRNLEKGLQDRSVQNYLADDVKLGFDLKREPLIRLGIFRLSDHVFQLVFSYHHIILDGWSWDLFMTDFMKVYEQLISHQDVIGNAQPPFSDYIAWIGSRDENAAFAYWKKYLQHYHERASLQQNVDTTLHGYKSTEQLLQFDETTTKDLLLFAAENGVTVSVLLQVIWGVVLAGFCARNDVVFGLVVSGRPPEIEGVENMLGLFINTVAVRICYSQETTIAALLQSVQSDFIDGISHHYVSLADVQKQSDVHGQLFDHILLFQNYRNEPGAKVAKNGSLLQVAKAESLEHTNYHLNVVASLGETLSVRLSYNTCRYDAAFIQQLSQVVEQVTKEIIRDSNVFIKDVVGHIFREKLTVIPVSILVNEERSLPPLHTAFTNPVEEKLAAIWQQLLPIENVRADDNFFDLGGHSLLAMRAISLISRSMEMELPIKCLFDNPTISTLSKYILSQKKGSSVPRIEIGQRPTRIPFSYNQEQLWLTHQLSGSKQYHIPFILKLRGKLCVEALDDACKQLVSRHEILRTVIREYDGYPYQLVKEASGRKLVVIDGSSFLTDKETQKQIDELINEPFDLSEDEMLRVHLIVLGEEDYLLLIVMHHIASDGWSFSILIKELVELYDAFIQERAHHLKSLPLQYADYALWQRQYLQGETLENKLKYWKDKLQNVELVKLPADYDRIGVAASRGATSLFHISSGIRDRLQDLSRQHNVTLFMSLMACFKVLLYAYSGQNDICVGSVNAGRQQSELDDLIGFFINTFALRSNVQGTMTFADLLVNIKQTTLEAYENQVPFQKVVESVVKERDPYVAPVFQVLFVLQNLTEQPEIHMGELAVSSIACRPATAKFDLTFTANDVADELQLWIEYDPDLFKETTIEEMANYYEQLLNVVSANPDLVIKDLITPINSESYKAPEKLRTSIVVSAESKTIIDLFQDAVMKMPDNIAVEFDDEVLTYKQLNERTNCLARYLRLNCIREEVLVPLCVERSVEMIVAIIGILKAGGAYVPIDPSYPQERIDYILADTRASLIIADKSIREKIQIAKNIAVCTIDDLDFLSSSEPLNDSEIAVDPSHLAYVMYTSGSTGKPKGVMIEHESVFNLIQHQIRELNIISDEKILQFSNYGFDASVEQVFLALCTGATLVLMSKEAQMDVSALGRILTRKKITHFHATPSYMEHVPAGNYGSLRRVIAGGEACSTELAKSWSRYVDFYNEYGPTETTVTILVSRYDAARNAILTIGRPLSNASIYIVDNDGRLCVQGSVGELYIGGKQLARGYLNLPEITRDKFERISFDGENSERLYKTGDLCKWLPDGNIAYIGRKDDQLKIRGYRIEPGEVEAALIQHETISQAVVIAKEDIKNTRRLTCYIVVKDSFDKEKSISFLKTKLPEYMIPEVWITVGELPLTNNGKIDKRKLLEQAPADKLYNRITEPTTNTEKALTQIWKDVLGVEQISIYDNFFAIGGHSLLANRVVSLIRSRLQMEISVKDVFLYPQIALLAKQIPASKKSILSANYMQSRPSRIPLSFSQESLWFIHKLEGSVHYHMPAVLHISGKLNTTALADTLHQIISRHEILRTVIHEDEEGPFQFIQEQESDGLIIVEDEAFKKDKDALQFYINSLIHEPFDLSKHDMLRTHLIVLNDDEHILVLVMHHIVSDGWSLSIFVKEMVELYEAFISHRQAHLVPLSFQYAEYALWQRSYVRDGVLESMLDYWKDKLKNVTPLQLPLDYPRPAVPGNKGETKYFTIPTQLSRQISQLSQERKVTLFMTLLACFKVLLYKYSGQEDICVGTVSAGRQQTETENLIGYFIHTFALRSKVLGDDSFATLLNQVKQTTVEAYEHQQAPFQKVVQAVSKERDISRSPLYQVMFILQNIPEIPEMHLGELRLSTLDYAQTTTKFDLTFTVKDTFTGLQVWVEYNIDLFKAETIEKMVMHYEQLLRSVVANPDEKVGSLQMLDSDEQHLILSELSSSHNISYQKRKTIVSLFEEAAEQMQDKVALVFGDDELSYEDLNRRANQLAFYLRSKGVKEDVLVPVCVDRSLEMIIAIMGILKSGAAYVPIDPEYPVERINYIIEDTAAKIMVCSPATKARLEKMINHTVQVVSLTVETMDLLPSDNLHTGLAPNHLAYVIYTSGSTGKPKGVMIEHRNVVRLFKTDQPLFDFDERDVWTLFHSYCFDFSVWEIFGALLFGGRLVIVPKELTRNAELFSLLLLRESVTVLNQTPSFFYVLQDYMLNKVFCPKLRYVIFGGEALNPSRLVAWKQLFTGCKLINMYGITETTVHVTYKELSWEDVNNNNSVIGKAIPTLHVYILNSHLQLVPTGVIGEIYVGGAGLARGYLNNKQLTDTRFMQDPFLDNSEARIYKTGDLGRWLPDGSLEFLGRIDDQVKIRGYRIEPGEIESVLQQHEMISRAVILLKEDKDGSKRLISYFVSNRVFDKAVVVSYLKSMLPEYMIPAIWVELKALPLTVNGKIDKRSLPDPDISQLRKDKYVAPRNGFESKMAALWKDVLNVNRVGVNDDFFEIGGDSILSIKLVNRIQRLGYAVQPKNIFNYPTIAALCSYLSFHLESSLSEPAANIHKTRQRSIVPVKTGGSGPPFFAIPGFFFYRDLAANMKNDQNFYGFEPVARASVEERAGQYIRELKEIQPKGPYYLGAFCHHFEVLFEMAHMLKQEGEKINVLALFESYHDDAVASYVSSTYISEKISLIREHLRQAKGIKKMKVVVDELYHATTLLVYKLTFIRKKKYVVKKYEGKVILFKASITPPGRTKELSMGWNNSMVADSETIVIQGDHMSIFKEPQVKELALKLDAIIAATK